MKKLVFLAVIIALQIGCQSSETHDNQYRTAEEAAHRPRVDKKYSLAADRQAMEEYRTAVPDEKKQENDELAFVLDWTQTVDQPPAKIRSEFQNILRKKRAQIDKDMKAEREKFTKEERRKRDDFLKAQKNAREDFREKKSSREESQRFYKDQNDRRQEFFADEREKRNDFESDVRERRKNFEDYVREKTNLLNQELRDYQKRYDEAKKAQKTQ